MHPTPKIRSFTSAHPVTSIAALAALMLILVDWRALLLLVSLVAVAAGSVTLGKLAIESRRRWREETAQIVARADDQHEALLYGDDQWGVFGVRPAAEASAQPFLNSGPSHRSSLVAGAAVVAGLLVVAVLATMNAAPPDRPTPARPVSAPTVTVPVPARRPIPRPMNPTPALGIPLPFGPVPHPALQTHPAAPVQMGQPAIDGSMTFVVTSVDRSKIVANPSIPFMQTTARGTFLTAQLTITNNGDQLAEFIASYQKLKISGAVYVPDPAAAVWTLTFETFVSPGTTVTATLSFDVPTDTPAGGTLELHQSSSSPGADVELLRPH
jgi:hypothetical protein